MSKRLSMEAKASVLRHLLLIRLSSPAYLLLSNLFIPNNKTLFSKNKKSGRDIFGRRTIFKNLGIMLIILSLDSNAREQKISTEWEHVLTTRLAGIDIEATSGDSLSLNNCGNAEISS